MKTFCWKNNAVVTTERIYKHPCTVFARGQLKICRRYPFDTARHLESGDKVLKKYKIKMRGNNKFTDPVPLDISSGVCHPVLQRFGEMIAAAWSSRLRCFPRGIGSPRDSSATRLYPRTVLVIEKFNRHRRQRRPPSKRGDRGPGRSKGARDALERVTPWGQQRDTSRKVIRLKYFFEKKKKRIAKIQKKKYKKIVGALLFNFLYSKVRAEGISRLRAIMPRCGLLRGSR